MSQTAIPNEFAKYMQNQISVGLAPDMNEMIFANIPDLDPSQPIDPTQGLPSVGTWVHQQNIDQLGKLGDNALVYSTIIKSDKEFTFNAIYLRDKNVPNSCGMVVHKAEETKELGSTLTRSLMMEYVNAAQIVGVIDDAATWQIDYQARLKGIEEDHRLACLDNYGHTAFVDGFDVTQQADPNKYKITPGVVYVGGLRAVLANEVLQTITTKPNGIYIDVVRDGTALSAWENTLTIKVSTTPLNDYVDEFGRNHYVTRLAGVNADGSVVDWRVKGALHDNYLTRADWLKHMLFKGMPMSAVGPDPDPDIWLPAGRVELLREDYPSVFEIVNASAFFTDQATIDADPRSYAGHWGTGDGATTFTTDDWALMMNIKVAGGYGAAGSTKEDHIQNISGSFGIREFLGGSNIITTTGGAFFYEGKITTSANRIEATSESSNIDKISFSAANSVRTSTITDTMGLYLDHYRVIPKGVFSYA